MRMVRAILIDPFECRIEVIDHDASDFRKIYEVINHSSMNVTSFDVANVGLRGRDRVYVDDEGLLKLTERFFMINQYKYVLAGKGLILGTNYRGTTVSAETQLRDLKIMFLQAYGKKLLPVDEPWFSSKVYDEKDLTMGAPLS